MRRVQVRFNPNLYANGKVCLSILGTWSGPGWLPTQSLSSVLMSIQSLMNERPYTNEPGFEQPADPRPVEDYNDVIAHETLRVAVLEAVTNAHGMPEDLRASALEAFPAYADGYLAACDERAARLDGKAFKDPFGNNVGTFR